MQVGDKIKFKPFVLRYAKDTKLQTPDVTGTVVWIHPEGRFAVVERQTVFYAYRECIPCARIKRNEVRNSENDRNHEPEGWSRQNRNRPHFGRRAAPRREDFGGS